MKERKVSLLSMEKAELNDAGIATKLEVNGDAYNIGGKKRLPALAGICNGHVSAKPSIDKSAITLGQTFKSFAEVSQAITMYESRHKVRLLQKYFRRIAANPKPSNKEDFMLSEEERKRFVYRWVDFCCTYFDDVLARADHNEEGGSASNNQVLGLAMKECPMRIRFQLRFNEKDIMISIFKEDHDHKHTSNDMAHISTPSKNINETISVPVTRLHDLRNTKRPRPPPPSLTPLPPTKVLKEGTVVSHSARLSLSSHLRSKVTPVNHTPSTLSIPKPPPLKAMPLLASSTEIPSIISSNEHVQDLSVEGVVKNIYQFLCRLQTQGSRKESDLHFTSPNPDVIKITSELSGMDTGRVLAVCQPKEALYRSRNSRNDKKSVVNSCLALQANCSSPSLMNPTINRVETKRSTSNRNFSDITVPSSSNSNYSQSQSYSRLREEEDNETRFMNMPVEVIIKAEPAESLIFYDENDSDNNMDMSTSNNYFRTERADANR